MHNIVVLGVPKLVQSNIAELGEQLSKRLGEPVKPALVVTGEHFDLQILVEKQQSLRTFLRQPYHKFQFEGQLIWLKFADPNEEESVSMQALDLVQVTYVAEFYDVEGDDRYAASRSCFPTAIDLDIVDENVLGRPELVVTYPPDGKPPSEVNQGKLAAQCVKSEKITVGVPFYPSDSNSGSVGPWNGSTLSQDGGSVCSVAGDNSYGEPFIKLRVSPFYSVRDNFEHVKDRIKHKFGSFVRIRLGVGSDDSDVIITGYDEEDAMAIREEVDRMTNQVSRSSFQTSGVGILRPAMKNGFEALRSAFDNLDVAGKKEKVSWNNPWALSDVSINGIDVEVVYNFEGFVEDKEAQMKNLVFVLPLDAAGAHDTTLPKDLCLKADLAFNYHRSASKQQLMRGLGFFLSSKKVQTPRGNECRICHINADLWTSPDPAENEAEAVLAIARSIEFTRDKDEACTFVIPMSQFASRAGCTGAGLMRRLLFKLQHDDAMMFADCGKLICSFDNADVYLEAQQVSYGMMADEQATLAPNLSLLLEDSELHECRRDMNAVFDVLDGCASRYGRSAGRREYLKVDLTTRSVEVLEAAKAVLREFEDSYCWSCREIPVDGPFFLYWAPNESFAIRHSVSLQLVKRHGMSLGSTYYLCMYGSNAALEAAINSSLMRDFRRACRQSFGFAQTCPYFYDCGSSKPRLLPGNVCVGVHQLRAGLACDISVRLDSRASGSDNVRIRPDGISFGALTVAVSQGLTASQFVAATSDISCSPHGVDDVENRLEIDVDEGFYSPYGSSTSSVTADPDVFCGQTVDLAKVELQLRYKYSKFHIIATRQQLKEKREPLVDEGPEGIRRIDRPETVHRAFNGEKDFYLSLSGVITMHFFLAWLWAGGEYYDLQRVFELRKGRALKLYESYHKAAQNSPLVVRCEVICYDETTHGAPRMPIYDSASGTVCVEDPKFIRPDYRIMQRDEKCERYRDRLKR